MNGSVIRALLAASALSVALASGGFPSQWAASANCESTSGRDCMVLLYDEAPGASSSDVSLDFLSSEVDTGRMVFPPEVEAALVVAGQARPAYEALLERYRQSGDREKYAAACFLVGNMAHHYTGGRVVSYDAAVDSFRWTADAAYYALIRGATAEEQESDPLHKTLIDSAAAWSRRVQSYPFATPEVEDDERPDVQSLDTSFVRRQIESAFALRRHVARVKRLPFRDFLEYILPYRAISGYPLAVAADTLRGMFAKYLQADTARSLVAVVERYNRANYWLRQSHGRYPFGTTIGYPDLFFTGMHDCIDQAEYCAQTLRACGVPAVVETNIAYRIWNTRHYMVAVRDEAGRWQPFNAEYGVPRADAGIYRPCLNIYRLHFGRQPDNPAALVRETEPVPAELADPSLEDVSAQYLDAVALRLPIDSLVPGGRKLAYLASFRGSGGLMAVTWGVREKGGFVFRHVIKDNIYFSVWCDDAEILRPAGAPFGLRSDSTSSTGYRLEPLLGETGRTVTVTLRRKYPRKPHLLVQARRTVGTVVLGSDVADFGQADTLAVITEVPEAAWTDLPLCTQRPYRYYRVQAPPSDPHLHLAELQFLTRRDHAYSNVMAPTPLSGGSPAEDATWQRLLDEPLEKCRWKAEYDGNVQSAPDLYPSVTLKLESPQWVECLRYVVKHADNGVVPGDNYVLRHWEAAGWRDVWLKQAETDSLDGGALCVGGLYWLANISRGNEELPFTINADGTVSFPHTWIVDGVERGRH